MNLSSFTSFFGHLGHALASPAIPAEAQLVGTVIMPFNPGLGALIETIAGAVYTIETKAAAGTAGTAKKDQVKQIVDVAAPVALNVLSNVSGKPVDASAVAPMIDSLIDSVVGIFNGLGVFTHAPSKPATPAQAAAVNAAPAAFIPAGVPSAH